MPAMPVGFPWDWDCTIQVFLRVWHLGMPYKQYAGLLRTLTSLRFDPDKPVTPEGVRTVQIAIEHCLLSGLDLPASQVVLEALLKVPPEFTRLGAPHPLPLPGLHG